MYIGTVIYVYITVYTCIYTSLCIYIHIYHRTLEIQTSEPKQGNSPAPHLEREIEPLLRWQPGLGHGPQLRCLLPTTTLGQVVYTQRLKCSSFLGSILYSSFRRTILFAPSPCSGPVLRIKGRPVAPEGHLKALWT